MPRPMQEDLPDSMSALSSSDFPPAAVSPRGSGLRSTTRKNPAQRAGLQQAEGVGFEPTKGTSALSGLANRCSKRSCVGLANGISCKAPRSMWDVAGHRCPDPVSGNVPYRPQKRRIKYGLIHTSQHALRAAWQCAPVGRGRRARSGSPQLAHATPYSRRAWYSAVRAARGEPGAREVAR